MRRKKIDAILAAPGQEPPTGTRVASNVPRSITHFRIGVFGFTRHVKRDSGVTVAENFGATVADETNTPRARPTPAE